MKRNRRALIIGAAVSIAVGLALCATAYALVGGDLSKLSTTPAYEEKSVSYSADTLTAVSLLDRNTSVRLEPSGDQEIHITYFENMAEEYYCSVSAGELRIEKIEQGGWLDRVGLNFHFQDTTVVIEVPQHYAGSISLNTTNALVTVTDLDLQDDLSVQTTNNGIQVRTVSCAGEFQAQTSNGKVALDQVTAASVKAGTSNHSIHATEIETVGDCVLTTSNGEIFLDGIQSDRLTAQSSNHGLQVNDIVTQGMLELRTTNGPIHIEQVLPGQAIEMVTTNGDIEGTVCDRLEQYHIDSGTTNGDSNLPKSYRGGSKSLVARTTNGNIAIDFLA